MNRLLILSILAISLVQLSPEALGQNTHVWTGNSPSQTWDDPSNWDTLVVPGPNDIVVFDDNAANFTVLVQVPTVVGEIQFDNNGANNYEVIVSASGTNALQTNAVTKQGSGVVLIENVVPGSQTEIGDLDILAGVFTTGSAGQLRIPTGGQVFVNNIPGTGPQPTLVIEGQASQIEAESFIINGELRGNGTALGDVDNNGFVGPGLSPGTITTGGDYTQDAGGILQIEIDSGTSFDVLDVGGSASLAGLLAIDVTGTAEVPTSAVITIAGTRTGVFSSVDTVGVPDNFYSPIYSSLPSANTVALALFSEGDMNIDGSVNSLDVPAFVLALRNRDSYFGTYFIEGDESGDIDDDNDLDFDDIDDFASLIPGVGTAQIVALLNGVPEPSSLFLCIVGSLLLGFVRRR